MRTQYKIHRTRKGEIKGRTISAIGVTPDGRDFERRSVYISEKDVQEYKRLVQKFNYRVDQLQQKQMASQKLEAELQLLRGSGFTPEKRTGSLKELAGMKDHKAEIRRLRRLTKTRSGEKAVETFAARQILIIKHRFINGVKRIIDDAINSGMSTVGSREMRLFEEIKNKILYMNRERFMYFINNSKMGFEYLYLDHIGDTRTLKEVLQDILDHINRT